MVKNTDNPVLTIIARGLLASHGKFVLNGGENIIVVVFRFGLTGLLGNVMNNILKDYFI